jgi:hypothetical protein
MSPLFAAELSAVATAVLAVFAIVTAFYARQAFRKQSQKSRDFPSETNMAVSGAILRFRDSAGVRWIRRPDGGLSEQPWSGQAPLVDRPTRVPQLIGTQAEGPGTVVQRLAR